MISFFASPFKLVALLRNSPLRDLSMKRQTSPDKINVYYSVEGRILD